MTVASPLPPAGDAGPEGHRPMQRWALWVLLSLMALLVSAASAQGWRQAALALVGVMFGATLYHASFGFASAYRRLIVHGDTRGVLAQVLMLAATTVLFAPLLMAGIGRGAVSPLALQAVLGATLFGVGMQLGSGCACGTLYTIGSGSGSMVITLVGFSGGSFLASLTPEPWRGWPRLEPMSLLERWGWVGVAVQLLVLAVLARLLWQWRQPSSHTAMPLWPRLATGDWIRGPWSAVTGAIALAVLSLLTLLLAGRPWGVTWGFTLWAAKVAQQLGWDPASSPLWQQGRFASALDAGLLSDTTSVMNFGIVLGAAAAAAAAGALRFRPPRAPRQILASLGGGLIMGYGAWLSFGCNVGAYFSGIASTSLHGWLWILCALAGTTLGVRLRPLFGLSN